MPFTAPTPPSRRHSRSLTSSTPSRSTRGSACPPGPLGPSVGDDGERFSATLGTRQRIVTGVFGIGLGFGAPFLLSVALVATSGDPSLLMFPLPFLGGLWAIQGLAPSG